jgi:hypothetical protein
MGHVVVNFGKVPKTRRKKVSTMREKPKLTALLLLLSGIIIALLISAEPIPAQDGARTQNSGNQHIGNHNNGSQDSGKHGLNSATQDWVELIAAMDKMHAAMGSVERSGDSDVDFVTLMLPHHQAAIDMAKTQLLYGKDPQMRRLAQEIITDQQSEIELMQLWLKQRDALTSKNGPKSKSDEQRGKP